MMPLHTLLTLAAERAAYRENGSREALARVREITEPPPNVRKFTLREADRMGNTMLRPHNPRNRKTNKR
jgi:hypothetical protein